jgi:hypothetical protein
MIGSSQEHDLSSRLGRFEAWTNYATSTLLRLALVIAAVRYAVGGRIDGSVLHLIGL